MTQESVNPDDYACFIADKTKSLASSGLKIAFTHKGGVYEVRPL